MRHRHARPAAIAVVLCMVPSANVPTRAGDEPVTLTKLKDRPGKTLFKAAYGKGGCLGSAHRCDHGAAARPSS